MERDSFKIVDEKFIRSGEIASKFSVDDETMESAQFIETMSSLDPEMRELVFDYLAEAAKNIAYPEHSHEDGRN